jgi:hypothetical protein
MQRVWARGDVHTGFWWAYLREREHLKDPGVDRKIILKLIFKKWDGGLNGLTRLRTGTGGGGLLSYIKFSKMQRYVTLGDPCDAARWQENYENAGNPQTTNR